MPTARELLDQADALMRRNRPAPAPGAPAAADDGIPTLMDAVPPAQASVPQQAPSARALVRAEAVNDLDDVPLLTDAVEEIEAPSLLDEPLEPEAPETWDDTLTGAHTIIPAVPVEVSPRAAAVDAPAVGALPEEWGAPAVHAGPVLAVETIDIPPPRENGESLAVASREPQAPPVSTEETLPNLVAGAPEESEPATPFEWTSAVPPAHAAASVHDTPALADAPEPPTAAPAAAQPPIAAPPTGTPPPAAQPSAEDDARWSALAEEIRMQVLQRIDLFTDTGLREQLGARLQPIVDRASADLVATINQHVGVLLRAYVAEAIEREIERWRAERR